MNLDIDRAASAAARGDYQAAMALAQTALAQGSSARAHHILAICSDRLSDPKSARDHFERALVLAAADPEICNTFAKFLTGQGEPERALELYRTAVAAAPDYLPAQINLGLLARRTGRFEEAREVLDRAAIAHPNSAGVWQALGLLDREIGNLDEAAKSLGKAAALAPQDALIARTVAQVQLERGLDARHSYRQAAALAPGDPEMILGLARAHVAAGAMDDAEKQIEEGLRNNPGWIAGHSALARLRAQLGRPGATSSFEAALDSHSADLNIWLAYIQTLNAMREHENALEVVRRARRSFRNDRSLEPLFDQIEATTSDEAGDMEQAARLFAKVPAAQRLSEFGIPFVRHLLRAGDPAAAAIEAQSIIATTGDRSAWAYLSIAWRLLDDPRWQWLECDDRLVGVKEVQEAAPPLAELATVLRDLHLMRTHPFDQTLRGGTQTDGDLFGRADPLIAQLRIALDRAVREHIAQLPPIDARHPTLSQQREAIRFCGSWSVRLTNSGFHINHIHPTGWLSSAFYVSLPADLGDENDPSGWLVLGEPPSELGIDLPALRTVKPEPGRLVLFPSIMWHGTRPFAAGERLTIAFDVCPVGPAAP